MILEENTVVADRFRLVRMIGRGGMGSVWQARHLGLDTSCALKFIEGDVGNLSDAHARFEREAKAAAQLRSPHVVQVFDYGVWQGRPYIAMELLDGVDLRTRLTERGGRLLPAEVHAIVQQVCRALTKAHKEGVVHRDLKPDNIFLVRDDGDENRELVKILDFGVAKSTAGAIDGSNTKTGAMLGTPYYMSPEQAQGIKSVDARSDLWSLAAVVFQCVTGRLPFESEALGDLLVKIIVNPVPVPSQVAAGHVPPGFDAWWLKAADRNPDKRFPTAKAFADSLALALGMSSITDATERSRLMQMAGSTELMHQGTLAHPGGHAAVPPHTAAIPQTTPHPAHALTPHPHLPAPTQAMMHQPPQMATPHNFSGAQPGATFSGVEPPANVPRNGLPLPVIAGLAGLVLSGFVGLGVVVVKRGSGSSAPTASASASVPPEVSSAPLATTGEGSPKAAGAASSEPASGSASASAATGTADAEPAGATAAATAGTSRRSGGSSGTAKTAPSARPSATAAATATATATASAKKWEPGF